MNNPRHKSSAVSAASDQLSLTRRKWLAASVALPAAAVLASKSGTVRAAVEASPNAIKNTFMLGDFEVSTLLAGTRSFEDPQGTFGMNVSEEEFAAVSAANFIPTDVAQAFFTPTVVRAGGEVILFDTGLNPAGITAPLASAGITPEEVTVVVITHMHGDHIGGLAGDDGTPTFPNARYVTGQVEYDAWAKQDSDSFNAKVAPLAEKMQFIGDGDSVVSGITSMAAFGHTPGHMTYMLESGGKQLAIMADFANHYVWSLGYPKWEVRFDMDKEKAAETRVKLLDMVTTDRVPFIGYHMPFPGVGYAEARGEGGYRFVPTSYQMML